MQQNTPQEPKKHKKIIFSTRDRVRMAKTPDQVMELLAKAETYEYISPQSLRRIREAARRRLEILGETPVTA
jgi:hypothetical protein